MLVGGEADIVRRGGRIGAASMRSADYGNGTGLVGVKVITVISLLLLVPLRVIERVVSRERGAGGSIRERVTRSCTKTRCMTTNGICSAVMAGRTHGSGTRRDGARVA